MAMFSFHNDEHKRETPAVGFYVQLSACYKDKRLNKIHEHVSASRTKAPAYEQAVYSATMEDSELSPCREVHVSNCIDSGQRRLHLRTRLHTLASATACAIRWRAQLVGVQQAQWRAAYCTLRLRSAWE